MYRPQLGPGEVFLGRSRLYGSLFAHWLMLMRDPVTQQQLVEEHPDIARKGLNLYKHARVTIVYHFMRCVLREAGLSSCLYLAREV